jgi:hypothetical protein
VNLEGAGHNSQNGYAEGRDTGMNGSRIFSLWRFWQYDKTSRTPEIFDVEVSTAERVSRERKIVRSIGHLRLDLRV